MPTGNANERMEDGRLQLALRWLRHWLPHAVVIAVGPGLLAAASLTTGDHVNIAHKKLASGPLLIGVGTVLLLAASIWLVRRQRHLDELVLTEAELERRAKSGEKGLLRLARAELDELRLRLHHFSSERMTLFRCDGDHFTLVARFSANPIFDRSHGRDAYPVAEGLVGRAWRDGSAYEPGIPPAGRGAQPNRGWLQAQARYGISEGIAAAFAMRSRWYAAFRIEGRDGPLGVLAIESESTADDAAERAEKEEASPVSTVLDSTGLEDEVKLASTRLARVLEESRSMDSSAIADGRLAIQEESFGVFGSTGL